MEILRSASCVARRAAPIQLFFAYHSHRRISEAENSPAERNYDPRDKLMRGNHLREMIVAHL